MKLDEFSFRNNQRDGFHDHTFVARLRSCLAGGMTAFGHRLG
jgi:hypothetical protein